MTLEVAAPAGVGASEEQDIHNNWDTMDAVMMELYKSGFVPPEKPVYAMPKIKPNELAQATSEQYSTWFMTYAGWQSYMSYQLSWIDGHMLQRQNETRILSAKIRTHIRKQWEGQPTGRGAPKAPSAEAIEDIVTTDPRIIQLLHELQQLKQRRELLEPQYEEIKTTLRLMSRSMEGRKLEAELAGKGGRMYGGSSYSG